MTFEQLWHRVPGGTGTAAVGLSRALLGRGNVEQIGVAALHRRPPRPPFLPPVEVRHLPLPRLVLYESWHDLRRPKLQRATGPVDLIHATGYAVPPKTAPLLVSLYDVGFVHRPEHFTRWGVRFLERSLELTRREADRVVCASDATRRDLLQQGISEERLRVVPLGVDVRPVETEEIERVRAAHGLAHPYVLFVGTSIW
jgi:glycosyltransferase involved in cell wall biosynthesis